MKVEIRGSGVAGLALALELIGRGAEVSLLERGRDMRRSASWLAGGMLAPWCERENAEEAVLVLGRGSIDWWDRAVPGLVRRNGTLVVASPRDTGELDRFAARTDGFSHVDRDAIGALEPDLAGRFARALFFEREAHLDPRKALTGLLDKLVGQGVQYCCCGKHAGSDADLAVDCTGIAAEDPDLRPVRGEMLLLHAPEVTLSRPVRFLHPRIPVYVVPRDNHHFMVGATMIESADSGPITVRSTMELLNAAYSLHPGFAEARIIETGAGLRPAYPDNLPRIRRKGRTVSLNGFYRHGFLLAPHFAAEAAELIFSQDLETAHEPHH
ncbi:glycine oxidase ThiO [Roseibium sp. Sym1]|uniref:glycine oxidase ThiO n=1 Tax=Roseibium sp. Sym1 TaxID=3016006 RepID=UPI0022B2DC3A|nr:glycine oxidase ThiO [Roseibium sp. Sym1]